MLAAGVGLLLLLFLGRLLALDGLNLHTDEIWSSWQGMGTPQQVLRWTPYDWPPLYFLALAAWQAISGVHPLALRLFTILTFLVASSLLFRLMLRLRDLRAALLVTLAFGALGFTLRVSAEVRGYMLMFTFMIGAWWFLERYFARPTLRRALPLALCLAGVFYTYLPGVISYLMLGLYALVVYRRALWRGWLPGLLALLLALPLLAWRLAGATERASVDWGSRALWPSLVEYFETFTRFEYTDFSSTVWVVILLIASALIVIHRRQATRRTLAFLLWLLFMPLLMYALNPLIYLFYLHYSMALTLGMGVWAGWGLAHLKRVPLALALAVLLHLNLYPFELRYDIEFNEPFDHNFEWLAQNVQWGDVVLIDTGCIGTCEIFDDKKWDYFLNLYFPRGLHFIDAPGNERRIWYVTDEQSVDAAARAAVQRGRTAGAFVGPARFLWRLYEAPPNRGGLLLANGMRFHGADVLDNVSGVYESGPALLRREGEALRLRLWWSAAHPIGADYNVGVYLLDEQGRVVVQSDGPPQTIDTGYPPSAPPPVQTSQWQPGEFFIEERTLTLPYPMDIGRFELMLAVYDWRTPNERVKTLSRGETLIRLQRITVDAW